MNTKPPIWVALLTLFALAWAAPPRACGAGGAGAAAPAQTEAYYQPPSAVAAGAAADAGRGGSCDAGIPPGAGRAACPFRHCGQHSGWATAEYLLWWTHGRSLPPLVTTSPDGTPRSQGGAPTAGVLGQDETTVLFGDEKVGDGVQSGGRFDVGYWLDNCETIGVGGSFFLLEGDSAGFFGDSPSGSPTLARPFFNAQLGVEDAHLVAFIDPSAGPLVGGRIAADSSMDVLGAESYLRVMIHRRQGFRVDLLAGYDFNRIDETLRINTLSEVLDPNQLLPLGTQIDIEDVFNVQNEFHGGVVGLMSEFYYCRWKLRTLAKLSVGNMRERVRISGSTTTSLPGMTPFTSSEGLLALGTNIGRYERDQTALIPELGLTLAYQLTDCIVLSLGYSFMYWNHVALAGDQVDRTLNLSQLGGLPPVGPARPAFSFRDTDFWAQGINFGVEAWW